MLKMLIAIFLATPMVSAQKSAAGKNGVVVSVSAYASSAGIEVMKKGGNAIDAAVATALVLAVTYPQAGNIAGGGFMLIRMADGELTGIDYREKAPAASDARMFLRKDGSVDSEAANYGYLVAGIPGTLRGLELAWKKYGRLPWADLVRPAVTLAEEGFVVYPVVEQTFEEEREKLGKYGESRKVFFKPNGTTYKAGERLVQNDLARTLRLIADSGAVAFYEGSLGAKTVADVRKNGGIWTQADLKAYRAVERKPIVGKYRGFDIIGMPPPSSGGITVIECLNILENRQLKPDDAGTLHYMVEAMRRSFFDRMRYQGDADFTNVPVSKLISKDYAAGQFLKIDPERASSSEQWNMRMRVVKEDLETTHFSIVDGDGNAVSNTFTLEDNFGSHAVVKDLGFFLNSEMHDFNIRPDEPNYQGGFGGNPNLIEPGKRMLSSMAPTIVLKDGRLFLVTGSPGGRTIVNTVVQMIVNRVDYVMSLREAVDYPRLNHNWFPDEIKIERDRWSPDLIESLKQKGHAVVEVRFLGDAHSIGFDPSTGMYEGEADTRRHGSALAY